MATRREIVTAPSMASRWRRRRMCILVADAPAPAALREVSGMGAFVETNARPGLGDMVELHHPEAGAISGRVTAVGLDGVRIAFDGREPAIAFALGAVAADMSRPA
jgi:hypothetical protein